MRSDYKEFLELVINFLGEEPAGGIHFKKPGAIHHARWMAKAIYALKIFMFRHQFSISSKDVDALREVCIFIVQVYVKAWFTAPNAISAPRNDIHLLRNLSEFSAHRPNVCQTAFRKLANHLWHLGEELVALAFFKHVSLECKRRMSVAIRSVSGCDDDGRRKSVNVSDIRTIEPFTLESLVTKNSMSFFEKLGLDASFLDVDPQTWGTRRDYKNNLRFVESLQVVNDRAERAVALMTEFNLAHSADERQKQAMLQIVEKLREFTPNCDKMTLVRSFEDFIFRQCRHKSI